MSLPRQILLGMFAGLAVGLFFGEIAGNLQALGDAFIMLLKMTIVPYMSFALIHAIGSLSKDSLTSIFKKGIQCFLGFWTLIIVTIYSLSWMFPKADVANYHSASQIPSEGANSLMQLFIPVNPFYALANDIIPAVVLFSLLFGIALSNLKEKKHLLKTLDLSISALMEITRWVTKLSPMGVFALMAASSGTLNLHQIDKLGTYIFAYAAGVLFLCFFLLPQMLRALSPYSHKELMAAVRPALLLSFTTANALISLPYVISALEDLLGHKEKDNRSAVESLVPIAYNFPTVGNLFVLLFLLFLASFYARPLYLGDYAELIGLGIPVLFGSANSVFIATSLLIDRLHLPIDGLSLFLQTTPFTRNFQTMASTMGIFSISIVISLASQEKLKWQKVRIFRTLTLGVALLVPIVLIGRLWSDRQSFPKERFSSLRLHHPLPHEVLKVGETAPKSRTALEKIRREKQLRVGYNPGNIPFCYFNTSGQLVGYDISLAHRLAKSLDCEKILFVPFDYSSMLEDIQSGAFDIAVGSISVNQKRLAEVAFSTPYASAERAFVVKDHKRFEFADSVALKRRDNLTLAALQGSTLLELVKQAFPRAEIRALDSIDSFIREEPTDAYFWTEEEGKTWSLIHPEYSAVVPSPSLGKEHYAYALSKEAGELKDFVNYWLNLLSVDGTLEEERQYWILGEEDHVEPRWSILHDVLHWTR